MNKFKSRLENPETIIADGAMGTLLQKMGLKSGEASESWNIKHPEKILEIHKKYINAGAELIETNTFGANYIRLKEFKLEDKMDEINARAARIARKAAGNNVIVAGAIGPTGKLLEPLGELTKIEAAESYIKQASILVNNGVDVIIIETMTDLKEMEQAVKSVKKFEIPVIAQMSFNESNKTVMGNTVPEIVSLLNNYNVDVIGVNCTPGPRKTISILKELNRESEKPLSVFPNAGSPQLVNDKITYPEGPDDFTPFLTNFINNNVKIIGGCCGTTPEIILAIKNKLK